ncbi:Eco57I restriction-modification methylase domain-containing protein [Methanosarcina mazei]|uniref:site-specific DNA-methyltransferase (adenine-specific) n=2 Tax=Methanosarcina mazei TaxID=2209 RepID=A0A0F8GBN3_METMZ|nr:N-6 DNA methylase [Methanosarcina mazei]AKB71836.1 hypothetical protein MSMAC_1946 [Methanosarcina mazei C16]KKG62742.1 hypothetical protein DU67_00405 [Methanosarcina mazei]
MDQNDRMNKLKALVDKYLEYKSKGLLESSSEQTIRDWLQEFLCIFGWDVRNTSQIIQDKKLSPSEIDRLESISSTNTKPDYTFLINHKKVTFLDAKSTDVNIKDNAEVAFQIKSYGWSVMAPCAFISNFEEFAIYDCTYIPERNQSPKLGRIYLTIDNYLENFEILDNHLYKKNIFADKLNLLYSKSLEGNRQIKKQTLDYTFANELSLFRLKLANEILINNKETILNNVESLSYITQIIINRVLFIRVCEARGIEEENLLKRYYEKGFWETFKESSYFEFYDHYDGPLFEKNKLINNLMIPNTVFESLLNYLYYPSPYRFDVISTRLLSDIYEILLSKKLEINGDLVTAKLKSEYTKNKGAVSTPQYIVQDIIRRTISKDKLLREGIDKLFENKILDIACGSGSFLIEAYDHLENIFLELYITGDDPNYDKYFVKQNGICILNLEGKKSIIENCIFGVDIDFEAVEVTKMSLCLKVVDSTEHISEYSDIGFFGKKILSKVGENILCGNSLVPSDILDTFPSIRDQREEYMKTNIFDFNTVESFKKVFDKKDGFDYIIGNPPYVEVKNYNTDLRFMHLYIKNKYISAQNGKVDLSIPYIERGLELLNDKGKIGFIVQKRFFKTDYGKHIRKLISEKNLVSTIIDFSSTSIFRSRITYVALLFLDKTQPKRFLYKSVESDIDTLESDLRSLNDSDCSTLSSSFLSSAPWNFSDIELLYIKSELLKYGTLGDFVNVKVGVQALWDRAYHTRPEKINDITLEGKSQLEDNFEIELDACRPLICNEKFYPFRNDLPDVYVIFPYDVDSSGNVKSISFSEYSHKFPLAGEYLLRNKDCIKENVETYQDSETWHLYTRCQNHGAIYPKVLIPMTSLDTYATVSISSSIYCDNANVYFLEAENKNEDSLYALASIINSTLFSVLARSIANPQTNGYFKFNKQFLEPIPFPVANFKNNYKNIVSELAHLSLMIREEQSKYIISSPSQRRSIISLLNNYWNKLDDLVYDLYELNDSQKNYFQSKGRNISRVQCLESLI